MKSLISINRKFMDFSPLELINIIEENFRNVKGLKMAINPNDEIELKYLKIFRFHMQAKGFSFSST